MTAAVQNITIEQGATWGDALTIYQSAPVGTPLADLVPVNLAGYDVRMHIRADIAAPDPLITLTLANGRIAVTPADGIIRRTISAADTALLAFDFGVYDLEIESPDGTVTRLLQGRVSLSPEVTK